MKNVKMVIQKEMGTTYQQSHTRSTKPARGKLVEISINGQ